MHGRGTMIWEDESKYQGEFKEGKIEGFGSRKFANGDSYTGEWENDLFHG